MDLLVEWPVSKKDVISKWIRLLYFFINRTFSHASLAYLYVNTYILCPLPKGLVNFFPVCHTVYHTVVFTTVFSLLYSHLGLLYWSTSHIILLILWYEYTIHRHYLAHDFWIEHRQCVGLFLYFSFLWTKLQQWNHTYAGRIFRPFAISCGHRIQCWSAEFKRASSIRHPQAAPKVQERHWDSWHILLFGWHRLSESRAVGCAQLTDGQSCAPSARLLRADCDRSQPRVRCRTTTANRYCMTAIAVQ